MTGADVARLDSLPPPVRRYLRFAVPANAPPIRTVHLRHDGFFRQHPKQRWFAIQGEQYFTLDPPGFVWRGRIRMLPFLWIDARDSLISGQGRMVVKFNSIFTMANVRGPEVDQGAQARWLAEMVWFPPAFAGERIQWEPIDDRSARATLLGEALPVSLVMEFDDQDRAVRVRGQRYRTVAGGKTVLTPWSGSCTDYSNFSGMQIPSCVEVTWDFEPEPFTYARFHVTELEYNPPSRSLADSPTTPRAAAG